MSATLRHRGPNGSDETEICAPDPRRPLHGWLGHTRLKIIDLTDAADQPMQSDDGSVALTYNGEIYNFRELRRSLEGVGHRFRSTGDTEVVLRAYLEWGETFVERLDGMFALAIWDQRCGRLLLARDRVGKKPLYYALRDETLTFGSEIKALLAAPWVEAEPDLSRLPLFLTYGWVPNPATLLHGIVQVPPASTLIYDGLGEPRIRRYWDAVPSEQPVESKATETRDIQRLVEDSVARRLIADVPLGALLSGGLDSSIVVALMTKLTDEPVRTFSAGFPDDASFDERSHARQVADYFGTEHVEFAVEVDAVALLDELVWHHDQPFADSSAIPTYLVCELARDHVTVVLTGDGADEVFGGYERFSAAALARRVPPAFARTARAGARALPRRDGYYSVRRRAQRFFAAAERPLLEQYLGWISVFDRDAIEALLRTRAEHVGAPMARLYERASHLPELDQILYANLSSYLPDDLAVKMDRMSMAHSLEARSPFLDTALVEYVARIPAHHKVGLRQTKPLLRRAFEPLLPHDVCRRRKHGFGVPVDRWFRRELASAFEDEVLSRDAESRDLFDLSALRRLWSDHRSGDRNHGARLWTILTLERWLRARRSTRRFTVAPVESVRDG